MPSAAPPPSRSWFRSPAGRRYGVEFALIVALKLIALVLIWAFLIRPYPHADVSPAAVSQRIAAPAAAEPAHD